MSKPLTIDLPYPARELSPNGGTRHHRGKIARLKKYHRNMAYLATMGAKGRRTGFPWAKAIITAHWYHPQKRLALHDDDNLTSWLKCYRDGVADAGVVKNDRHCKMGEHHQAADAANPRIVLTFTEVVDGPDDQPRQCG